MRAADPVGGDGESLCSWTVERDNGVGSSWTWGGVKVDDRRASSCCNSRVLRGAHQIKRNQLVLPTLFWCTTGRIDTYRLAIAPGLPDVDLASG
mgnify:CR=1 FL=1|jgi:hypothetical protein